MKKYVFDLERNQMLISGMSFKAIFLIFSSTFYRNEVLLIWMYPPKKGAWALGRSSPPKSPNPLEDLDEVQRQLNEGWTWSVEGYEAI